MLSGPCDPPWRGRGEFYSVQGARCDQLVDSSWIGWYQDEVSSIISFLISTSLRFMFLWSSVFIWRDSASYKTDQEYFSDLYIFQGTWSSVILVNGRIVVWIVTSSLAQYLFFVSISLPFLILTFFYKLIILIGNNYFTILCCFLPYMNQPQVYMCPPQPEPPFYLPPHPVPLGHCWAPALCALLHVLNLHWSSILYMVMYMFCILSNHPTLAFSCWVQKSVLYIYISSAALNVGSLIPSF